MATRTKASLRTLSAIAGLSVIALVMQSAAQAQPPSANGDQQPHAQKSVSGMSTGSSSTGPASAAIYDAEHRPITAGGFVDVGVVVFKDITKQAGLANWRHVMGTEHKKFIIEVNGSGVGLIDYDNDGWLDIYMVNGSTFNALDGQEEAP